MRLNIPIAVLVAALAAFGGLLPQAAAETVRAGAAYQEFIFERKVPLAGFSRRKGKPAEGIHDPVGVRVLVVEDSDTRLILASCDLLVVDEHLYDSVRKRIQVQLPQDKESVLFLIATHTHSGPGAYGRRFLEKLSMGHYDPQVFNVLVESIVSAAQNAAASLSPIRLAYSSREVAGLVRNRVAGAGAVDPELRIAALAPQSGKAPLAVLVNFSAHPTTLGAWNQHFSADYPGVLCRAIEAEWPSTICLFLAGAVGDQAPIKQGEGYEPAERLGGRLAEEAVSLIRKGTFQEIQEVRAQNENLPLDPAQVRLGRFKLPGWISRRLADDDAALVVASLGPFVLAGVPCDMTVELGGRFRQWVQDRGKEAMLVGFANDYIGYCIPSALYGSGHYESQMAFNGPNTGEQIITQLMQMIDSLLKQESGE